MFHSFQRPSVPFERVAIILIGTSQVHPEQEPKEIILQHWRISVRPDRFHFQGWLLVQGGPEGWQSKEQHFFEWCYIIGTHWRHWLQLTLIDEWSILPKRWFPFPSLCTSHISFSYLFCTYLVEFAVNSAEGASSTMYRNLQCVAWWQQPGDHLLFGAATCSGQSNPSGETHALQHFKSVLKVVQTTAELSVVQLYLIGSFAAKFSDIFGTGLEMLGYGHDGVRLRRSIVLKLLLVCLSYAKTADFTDFGPSASSTSLSWRDSKDIWNAPTENVSHYSSKPLVASSDPSVRYVFWVIEIYPGRFFLFWIRIDVPDTVEKPNLTPLKKLSHVPGSGADTAQQRQRFL